MRTEGSALVGWCCLRIYGISDPAVSWRVARVQLGPHLTSDYVHRWRGCFRFSVSHRHRITRSSLLDCSHTEALVCSRAKLPKSAPFSSTRIVFSHDTHHLNVMIDHWQMSGSTAIQYMYLFDFFSCSRFLGIFLLPHKLLCEAC